MKPERERALQALKIAEEMVYKELQDFIVSKENNTESKKLSHALTNIQHIRAILYPRRDT